MGVMLRHGVNTHSTFNASDFVHFLPSGPLDVSPPQMHEYLRKISKND